MTRPGTAVETAALWKPWKNGRIEKPANEVRFFHRYQALGKRLALLARFPQLHTAATTGHTNRFHPARFTGPRNRPKRSANALLTGIQHTGSGQQVVQPLHG